MKTATVVRNYRRQAAHDSVTAQASVTLLCWTQPPTKHPARTPFTSVWRTGRTKKEVLYQAVPVY